MTEPTEPVSHCPLCRVNYQGEHKHERVEDVIVDQEDPLTGEVFSTWATMANKDWPK